MKQQIDSSIRMQLLVFLLVPLCALWLVSAAIAYYLAVDLANEEYDHQLIDSADSVVARIEPKGSSFFIDLPPAAQAILRHNDRDKFYYQILRKDGTRLSGDAMIPGPVQNPDSAQPVLRNGRVNGAPVRIARLRVDLPDQTVLVQVAETLNSRHRFAQQILLSILIPQMVLIALGAFAVWRGVSKGLAPLKALEQALASRSQLDLTPIPAPGVPVEVRPLVNAINGLLIRLAQDIETQQRFVANAAHEFRTPLAALKTFIYAAKKLPADKRMNDMLDKIDAGTKRMSHLSNKLLALAKAEPANQYQIYSNVDLNLVASEVTAGFAAEAIDRDVDLKFSCSDAPAVVVGDAHNLSELTANLVENAVFHSYPGSVVSVKVSAGNGDGVRLVVEDNGPGIPQDERPKVFERFYRLLGTHSPGSGLGLSIVKEIADSHNALVSIDDGSNGIGTVVNVRFLASKTGPKMSRA